MSLTGNGEPSSEVGHVLDDTLLRRKLADDFGPISLYHMRVFLRVRPFASKDISQCLSVESSQSVLLTAPEDSATFRNHSSNEAKTKQRFTFTRVFGPNHDQKSFFNGAILSTMSEFVNGQNCLVFAYGTTNSGKTYTVQGSASDPGIIPHAAEVIFNSIGDRLDTHLNLRPLNTCFVEQMSTKSLNEVISLKETLLDGVEEFYTSLSSQISVESSNLSDLSSKDADTAELSIHECQNFRFQIWISFAEIYNENIFDLLDTCPEARRKLRLTIDRTGNNYIKGLKILPVDNPKEARQFLSLGRKNLHIAATKLNQVSSRSHCIFTIYLVRVVDSPNPQQAIINSLSFCDLAGSERVVKTQNTGQRLKEAGKINNSLMVFGRCIEALRVAQNSRERPVIPFRDSKLTQLFQLFFSGKGRASMIVNVSPASAMFDDTVNVLRISAIAKQVVSADQLDKTVLNITSQRLTDLWTKSGQRWSSFSKGRDIPNKMSIMTAKEDSVIVEEEEDGNDDSEQQTQEEEADVQELIDIIVELEKKYNDLVDENAQLEMKLRAKLCQEFQTQLVDIGNSYERRIAEMRANSEEYMEKRLEIAEKAILASFKYSNKSTEKEDSDSEMEEEAVEAIDVIRAELIHLKSEWQTLSQQLSDLQLKLAESENKTKSCESQVLSLSDELSKTKKEHEEINLKRDTEYESKILTLSSQIDKKDQEIQRLKSILDVNITTITKSENKTKSCESQVLTLSDELSKMKKEHEELNLKRDTEYGSNILTLSSQIDNKDKEIQRLKSILDVSIAAESEVCRLQQELEEKLDEVQNLKNELHTTQASLTEERTSSGNMLRELKLKHSEKVSLLEKEIQVLSTKISCAEAYLAEERSHFEMRMNELQAENGKKIKSLQEEMQSLIKKVSGNGTTSLTQQKRTLENCDSSLDKSLKTLEEEFLQTKQELEGERLRANTLESSLKKSEKICNRAIQDLEKIGSTLCNLLTYDSCPICNILYALRDDIYT